MEILAYILSILFIVLTALPFINKEYWWIRIFDFPRAQLCLMCFITLVGNLYYLDFENAADFFLAALTALAFFYQFLQILPFTNFYKTQSVKSTKPDKDRSICLMVSNIRMDNRKVQKFLKLVEQNKPDILLINEPDEWWRKNLKVLDEVFEYKILKPLENTYGMMLYSKLRLTNPKVRFLVDQEIPSFYSEVELRSKDRIDLYCVHPKPPSIGSNTEKRDAELVMVGKEVKKNQKPAIVAGDLNDVAWSHTTKLFQRISGLIDPRVGRGFYNTYNAFIPVFRYPLDHIFYSTSFKLICLQRLPKFGSDHFPILIKICYDPSAKALQEKPQADHEDHKEAEEKLEKVK